jgi:hypothetical protein
MNIKALVRSHEPDIVPHYYVAFVDVLDGKQEYVHNVYDSRPETLKRCKVPQLTWKCLIKMSKESFEKYLQLPSEVKIGRVMRLNFIEQLHVQECANESK